MRGLCPLSPALTFFDRWMALRSIAAALEGSTRAVAYEASLSGHLDRLLHDGECRKQLPKVGACWLTRRWPYSIM